MLSSSDLKKLQDESSVIIRQAGEYIIKKWPNIKYIKHKDKRDLVTNVDIEVENMLRDKLHYLLPEAGFIVEEGVTKKEAEYNWTVDPIDGTKNFARSAPHFATQCALLKSGEPVLGHVFIPFVNHLFSASLHNGAFFNGEQILVKTETSPNNSIVEVVFGGNDSVIEWKLELLSRLCRKFYRTRIFAGPLDMYIVTGAIDAIVILRQDEKTVDNAPREIIYREAGLIMKEMTVSESHVKIIAKDILVNKISDIFTTNL